MATVVSPPVEGAKKRIGISPVTRRMFYLLVAYVVMCVYLSLAAPNFLTERNLVNILRQMSMIAIIGVGMTMVIIARYASHPELYFLSRAADCSSECGVSTDRRISDIAFAVRV